MFNYETVGEKENITLMYACCLLKIEVKFCSEFKMHYLHALTKYRMTTDYHEMSEMRTFQCVK